MSDPVLMRYIGNGALAEVEVRDIVARDGTRWNIIGAGW